MMNLIYPYYQIWFKYIASWPTVPYYQPYLGFTSIPSRLIDCFLLIPPWYHTSMWTFTNIIYVPQNSDLSWKTPPDTTYLGWRHITTICFDVTKVTLAPEIYGNRFKSVISEYYIFTSCQIAHMNTKEHLWRYINIGSSNSLVPSGTKPLLAPIWPIYLSSYDITLSLRKKHDNSRAGLPNEFRSMRKL